LISFFSFIKKNVSLNIKIPRTKIYIVGNDLRLYDRRKVVLPEEITKGSISSLIIRMNNNRHKNPNGVTGDLFLTEDGNYALFSTSYGKGFMGFEQNFLDIEKGILWKTKINNDLRFSTQVLQGSHVSIDGIIYDLRTRKIIH
jgi:hypothetical protein